MSPSVDSRVIRLTYGVGLETVYRLLRFVCTVGIFQPPGKVEISRSQAI